MNEKTCVEYINDHLMVSDENLAARIYTAYKFRKDMHAACLRELVNAYQEYLTPESFKSLQAGAEQYINTTCDDEEQVSIEALAAWSKYNHVDTKIDINTLVKDIAGVYRHDAAIGSKYSLEHYVDSNNVVKKVNFHKAYLICLEAIIEGRLRGMTGAEYMTHRTMDLQLDNNMKHACMMVFRHEQELVDKCQLDLVLASTEKFFASDIVAGDKIASCPQLPETEFKKTLKEGDVLIVYRKPKYLGLGGVILNKINAMTTGSSFMSIKLVGPEGKSVIGYGAFIGSTGCREVPIDYFIETCSGIICIRHKDIKPYAARNITKYARNIKNLNVPYNPLALFKTLFRHNKEAVSGPTRLMSKDQAKRFYAPMICTTLILAAYKGAGLDPGVAISDDIAWPIDVLKSSMFNAVSTYFDKDQGMDLKKNISSYQSLNPGLDEKVDAALEVFFSREPKVVELIRSIKKVNAEQLKQELKEGDAITVTRIGKDSFKSWVNKHIMQGQSFTSLKMIGPDAKTVIGFGVELSEDGGKRIGEVPIDDFIATCRAIVVCRPKEATPDKCHMAYNFMKSMQDKKIPYMNVGKNLVSCIKHIFQYGKKNDKTPLTKEELANYKRALLCSSVVANALRYAGIDNGFHSTAEEDVWPRDFLLSDKFTYPCAYFVEGELPEVFDNI